MEISIHALLAESDGRQLGGGRQVCHISIHALLAESDCWQDTPHYSTTSFLSTLSLRRATSTILPQLRQRQRFLSTLSLRRATPMAFIAAQMSRFLSTLSLRRATGPQQTQGPDIGISIHALLAESDGPDRDTARNVQISIHALLAESDYWRMAAVVGCDLFLSTLSLRRATHTRRPERSWYTLFLSTLSLRRATALALVNDVQHLISIHALLAESDHWLIRFFNSSAHFYPRSPCGERHAGH